MAIRMKKGNFLFFAMGILSAFFLFWGKDAFAQNIVWHRDGSVWIARDAESGELLCGWFQNESGTWYYANQCGTMQTGWILTDGKWYYLSDSGAMLQNAAAPNLCYLGKDGAYVSPDSAEASSVFGEEVIRLTNTERNKNGLPVLHVNTTLMEIANTRAEELKTVFSHTRPDGSDWFVLYDIYEYPFEIHEGENIAKGFLNPEEVVGAWMNSEEHRDNILHTNIKEIGAAFTRKDGVDYWVECFG